MAENNIVYEINEDFPFSKLSIQNIEPFIKSENEGKSDYKIMLSLNENPIYIQLPQCITNCNETTIRNQRYCELIYLYRESKELIKWMKRFEDNCKDLLKNKKFDLFTSSITDDDIDKMMRPIIKLNNSGTNILFKSHFDIDSNNNIDCIIYDENETEKGLDYINNNNYIIPLINIQYISFTSSMFEIYIKLEQIMITEDVYNVIDKEKTCMIKNKNKYSTLGKEQENCTSLDINKNTDEKNDSNENNKNSEIIEVSLDNLEIDKEDNMGIMKLNKPNNVYIDLYKEAKKNALKMRKKAIEAYLEAKKIKTNYMLQHLDDSDDSYNSDDSEYYSENENENVKENVLE